MKEDESSEEKLIRLAEDCKNLRAGFQTLLLATTSKEGVSESSYAPYVCDHDGCFYIFVSELASHTVNMIERGQCSVFFIRNEAECRNLFARERLSYCCEVEPIPRDSTDFTVIMPQMVTAFGEMINLLKGLGDFHLLRLRPIKGRYVVGFGQAFDIDPASGLLSHVDLS
ncbi:MAG: pyridoxamine 5'-phosphate oxidase family protein [Motiliproteus sp.]